jgi:hypothetical protein
MLHNSTSAIACDENRLVFAKFQKEKKIYKGSK